MPTAAKPMRCCETCGGSIELSHPFRVCPKCLLAEALAAEPSPAGDDADDDAEPRPAVAHLVARRDFFQKYDLLEKIAEGGQGCLLKVWDFELRRCIAMKRLTESAVASAPVLHRFLAEAQIASQLDHPGILPIFDVGLDPEGRPFYTTQLLPNLTLAHAWSEVRAGRDPDWTLPRAVESLLRVCEVMAHAHSRGAIHRDLKPSNILIGPFGDVRVIDWGSAHVLEQSRDRFEEPFVRLSRQPIETDRSEEIFGSPGSPLATSNAGQPVTLLFTPPEILAGAAGPPGPPTDVYAVGVMLYELLAGRLPYLQPGVPPPPPKELREIILRGPPVPVRDLNPSISRDLAAICAKAMAPAAERYPTMPELADDLRAALEVRPVKARNPGALLKFEKFARRNFATLALVSLVLLAVAAGFAIARGLRAQRDVARQVTALRNAELATRSGHWRVALRDWDEAEAAGYRDPIYLGLQRAQAWTVLTEPEKSGRLLKNLAARSDLGGQRGVVLLALGEHELFESAASRHGVQLVRDALSAGLTNADRAFAQGLLAESSPDALARFHEALRFNPYHHGAHRHSLSLEFLLGRRQDLSNHVAIFKILYPDDPSPAFLEATMLALDGDAAAADARLASLRDQAGAGPWEQLRHACASYAQAAKFYDLDTLLNRPPGEAPFAALRSDPFAAGFALQPGMPGTADTPGSLRLPQQPCLQAGFLEAADGLRNLLLPYLGNPATAVQQIRSGWRRHPEGMIPVLGAILLGTRAATPESSPAILQTQAELFQLGADSPSMMPQLARLARYLATGAELELANLQPTNAAALRGHCVENIRRAAAADETSAAEFRAYAGFASKLDDADLARELVNAWQRRHPGDPAAARSRIEVELRAKAFATALALIDARLAEKPDDAWAREQRAAALAQFKQAAESAGVFSHANP